MRRRRRRGAVGCRKKPPTIRSRHSIDVDQRIERAVLRVPSLVKTEINALAAPTNTASAGAAPWSAARGISAAASVMGGFALALCFDDLVFDRSCRGPQPDRLRLGRAPRHWPVGSGNGGPRGAGFAGGKESGVDGRRACRLERRRRVRSSSSLRSQRGERLIWEKAQRAPCSDEARAAPRAKSTRRRTAPRAHANW